MSILKKLQVGSKTVLPEKIYRHEVKYEADFDKGQIVRADIEKMLQTDENAGVYGNYAVKSLYFETPYSSDYSDKELGVRFRQKMRLRSYGNDDLYRLEIKSKSGDVATKYSVNLNGEQARLAANGEYGFLGDMADGQAVYIYHQLVTRIYRPLVTVSYNRYAYTNPAGNFRLTFDEDLRFSANPDTLFLPNEPSGVVSDKTVIEVKYDDFAPIWITDYLLKSGVNAGESSKYAAAFKSIFD